MVWSGGSLRIAMSKAGDFADMAMRIDMNAEADFAGAFVVVPPEGEAITLLVLDNRKNAAVFWGLLKSHAEIALREIDMAQRESQGWGRR